MKPLAQNTLLQNRYLVVHIIGKGGMGEVYLAVDQRLGSAVALKRTSFTGDEMLANAFEHEARTLARLRHPALPKVSDHFVENDMQYLVMEHITGDDLAKRLEETKKPFPLNWVLFWSDQLLDALAYLHSHEPPIIHRDVKPQNLKLAADNHIVLLDFGLAKSNTAPARTTTTGGGSIIGYTPHYAPMEQIRGTGTNARSDIYALSATIYQLLTNVVPADAISRADNVLNNLPDLIEPVTKYNAEVPETISQIVLKGMSIRQDERWQSAREMQAALRAAYNEHKQIMSASTLAFDVPRKQAEVSGTPRDVVSAAPPAAHSNTAPSARKESPATADFDATIRDVPLSEFAVKPSEAKTETISGISASIPSSPEPAGPIEKLSPPGDDNFAAHATVPLINFSGAQPSSESRSPGGEDSFAPAVESAGPVGSERADNPQTFTPAATPAAAPTPKKSGNKTLAAVGALAALLIVGGGIVGIGWYALKDRLGARTQSSPTPRPSLAPSASPTAESTVEANANSSSTPESSDIVTSNSNVNSAVKTIPTPVVRATPTPQPTRTVTAAAPKVVTQATPKQNIPVGHPTPKSGGGRTDILQ
jgi:serine/threonine protein kinase